MSHPVHDLDPVTLIDRQCSTSMRDGDPLRVLHCIHALHGGGAERQLKLLAGASHSAAVQSAIFCVEPGDTGTLNVPIYQAKKKGKFDLSIYNALMEAISDFQPDVIHAWLPASMTIPAMIAAKRRGIPCIYSYRNAMRFHRPLSFPEYAVASLCSQRIISNNPIAQSIAAYRALFRAKSGVTIPNAVMVDPSFAKTSLAIGEGVPTKLLFVGRLTRQKNIDCLLRALAMLPPALNWRQTICGIGEDEAALRKLAEDLHLADKVDFCGYRHDVYALMQQSDILVLPSWWEGMPNVLLEGLAIGLPCIASDIAATRSLLSEDCCTFFDPASPLELSDAIETLIRNQNRVMQQVSAGRKVVSTYSIEKLVERYAELYRGLVAGRKDPNGLQLTAP